MILELQLFQYRIVFTLAKVEIVKGVYSTLKGDMHFLMWDFDNTDLDTVVENLMRVGGVFDLPQITILETKKGEGYHAYCLCAVTFQKACEILAATEGIDMRYFTGGVARHKWTLRLSSKSGREIKQVYLIESYRKETVKIEDIKNFCMFKTVGDKHKPRIIKIGGN